jgi:hypothetical protein
MLGDISIKELIQMQIRTIPMYKKIRCPVSPVLPTVSEREAFLYCIVVTCMYYLPLIFLNVSNYEIIHADTRYCTLYIWAVVLLISEILAIINDLDVILHGFVLQIIYTTVDCLAV